MIWIIGGLAALVVVLGLAAWYGGIPFLIYYFFSKGGGPGR